MKPSSLSWLLIANSTANQMKVREHVAFRAMSPSVSTPVRAGRRGRGTRPPSSRCRRSTPTAQSATIAKVHGHDLSSRVSGPSARRARRAASARQASP